MSRWNPIETAPWDGTKVDLWIPFAEFRETDCHWNGQRWERWGEDGIEEVFSPSHWMKIPDPPVRP